MRVLFAAVFLVLPLLVGSASAGLTSEPLRPRTLCAVPDRAHCSVVARISTKAPPSCTATRVAKRGPTPAPEPLILSPQHPLLPPMLCAWPEFHQAKKSPIGAVHRIRVARAPPC